MPRRFSSLSLVSLSLSCVTAGAAWGHRLVVDYTIRPDGKVQVESWFDPTGNSARHARVKILRADDTVLHEGFTDSQGVYVFSREGVAALKIVVSAGEGHRAETDIPGKDIAPTGKPEEEATTSTVPVLDRRPRESLKDILTGITFVLALGAFILSVQNARRLRQRTACRDPNRDQPLSAGNTSSSGTSH